MVVAELEWHDFSLKKQTKLKTNLKIISKSSIVSPTLNVKLPPFEVRRGIEESRLSY